MRLCSIAFMLTFLRLARAFIFGGTDADTSLMNNRNNSSNSNIVSRVNNELRISKRYQFYKKGEYACTGFEQQKIKESIAGAEWLYSAAKLELLQEKLNFELLQKYFKIKAYDDSTRKILNDIYRVYIRTSGEWDESSTLMIHCGLNSFMEELGMIGPNSDNFPKEQKIAIQHKCDGEIVNNKIDRATAVTFPFGHVTVICPAFYDQKLLSWKKPLLASDRAGTLIHETMHLFEAAGIQTPVFSDVTEQWMDENEPHLMDDHAFSCDRVAALPQEIQLKNPDNYACYAKEAYRTFMDAVESGKYEGVFEQLLSTASQLSKGDETQGSSKVEKRDSPPKVDPEALLKHSTPLNVTDPDINNVDQGPVDPPKVDCPDKKALQAACTDGEWNDLFCLCEYSPEQFDILRQKQQQQKQQQTSSTNGSDGSGTDDSAEDEDCSDEV